MTDVPPIDDLYQRAVQHRNSDYVAEAVRCYNSGAYRACIIMISNAVFSALQERMEELEAGQVSRAGQVVRAVKKAIEEKRTYEGALLKELRKSKVVPVVETDALGEILTKRNHAAHPNNSAPTAKDAYYVFEKAVTYFLCEQARPLRFAIDTLMRDIYTEGFFTDAIIDDVARKVDEEIAAFNEHEHYQLINELTDRVAEEMGDEDSKSLWFLLGLLELDRSKLNSIIAKEVFAKRGFSPERDAYLVDMCVVRPGLLSMISGENRKRLDDMFANFIESLEKFSAEGTVRSPTALLVAIADNIKDPCIDTGYPRTVDVVLRRFWAHPDLAALFNTNLRGRVFNCVIEEAKRTEDDAETDLASYLEREDSTLADALTRGQIETLFIVLMASDCRKDLRELREGGFDRIQCLREVMSLPKPPLTGFVPTTSYLILEGNDLVREFRQRAEI
ncbi:hypothetical protein [Rhizobium sp. 22-785-1]